MNTSPFNSATEFLEADGAIYAFANSPGILYFLTFLCVAIMIYFIVKAYTIKH